MQKRRKSTVQESENQLRPEVRTVDLFEWVGERMLRKLEAQPITVTFQCSDGSFTVEIGPKHPWYAELSRRKAEQIAALRAKFRQ